MTSNEKYPTQASVGPFTNEDLGYDDSMEPGASNVPWVDIHQHTQTLTWNDRERFDMTGARAVVDIAGSYFQTPYRPVKPEHVRFLWDDALKRSHAMTRCHFFDVYLAVRVHLGAWIADVEGLLSVLPEYCALDEVVAIGETGIDPIQTGVAWDLEAQRSVLAEQMRVARDADLPTILHTPSSQIAEQVDLQKPKVESDQNPTSPQFESENAKRTAIEIDVEIADEVGLPHDRKVVDHADRSVVEYVLEETDCYLSFTTSYGWLTGVTPVDVADAIETYGPDRILFDSDLIGIVDSDVFSMKRTIQDLLRLGIDPEDVRTVAYENPIEILDFDLPA